MRSLDSVRLHVINLDVTCQIKTDEALRYVEQNLPKLGLWGIVNNAGVGNCGFLEWIPLETFEKVIKIKKFLFILTKRK